MKIQSLIVTVGLVASTLGLKAQSLQEGMTYLESERYGKAVQVFHQLNATQAKPDVLYYLGKIYLERGSIDSAKLSFKKALEVNSKSEFGYIGMGRLCLEDGRMDDASKEFQKAMEIAGSKNVNALTLIGKEYTQAENKDFLKAAEYLNKAIKEDPRNAKAYLALGDLYLEKNEGGLANSNYEKALSVNPNYTAALVQQGTLWTRAKNAELAEIALNKAIASDANFAPAYRELAELQYLKKNYADAVNTYKKYLNLTDNNIDSKVKYAKFLFLSKEYSQTVATINEIFAIDSSSIILKRLMGYSLAELNQSAEGFKYMDKFLNTVEAKKIIASDHMYMGRIMAKIGKETEAIEQFNKALVIDSNLNEVYGEIAAVYFSKKDYAKASEFYKIKMDRATKRSSADYFRLGQASYYAYQLNQTDTTLLQTADNAFTKVCDLSPNHPSGYIWKGRINSIGLEASADKTKPKQYFDKVVELAVANPGKFNKEAIEAYKYQAYLAIQNSDNTGAKAIYQKILELDPNDAEAQKNLKAL